MNHTLIRYLRNTTTTIRPARREDKTMGTTEETIETPVGVVVATIRPSDNKVAIGYSFVKPKSGDKFDKELGLKIAIGRAACTKNRQNKDAVFAGLRKHHPEAYAAIYEMYHRACRYFVDKEVVLP